MIEVVALNRRAAERVHKRAVRHAILSGRPPRQWLGPHSDDCLNVRRRPRDRLKLQRLLAHRGQLDIDLAQQPGIEQRARYARSLP
jgi:hypothetical protein